MSGITLESLRGSKYPDDLIDELKSGNLAYLLRYSTKMNSVDFMRDLIYAVKEEHGTYDVFLYYSGPAVQQNEKIATEIFREAPELIQRTVLSGDREFIKKNLADCPGIVAYIDEDLKNDQKFRAEVASTGITIEPSVTQEIVQDLVKSNAIREMLAEDSSLSSDPNFMLDAIKEDAEFLNNAASDLRENPNFMRIVSDKNEDVIGMVVQQIEDFNFDAIQAVRESSRELTIEDCMTLVDQYIETHDDPRYQKVKDKIQERGMEDPRTMKWITAMVAQMDDVSPDLMKKIVDYSMLTMEKTRRDLDQDGKMVMNMDVAQAMITPLMLRKLMSRAEENGVTLDEEMHQAVDSYIEFYDEFRPQFVAYKKKLWEQEHPEQEVKPMTPSVDANTPVESEIDADSTPEVESTNDEKVVALQGNGGLLEAIGETGMKEITEVESEVKRDAKYIPEDKQGPKVVKDSIEM